MNRTHPFRPALLLASLALTAVGCSSTQSAVKPAVEKPSAAPTGPVSISNRAMLLFDDAVKSFDAQKKAKAFDYPSLERKFRAAVEADQNLAEAEYNLGVIAERMGKPEEAKARYQAALTKKPSLRQASDNLAIMRQNSGDVAGAVALYQDVLTRYPDDAGSRARLAEIYRQNNDHDKAMELSRAALMRDPQNTNALKVMIRSYLERKQLAMAKLVALRAVKLDATDPELHHAVGLILQREGDNAGARVQFKSALEAKADYVPSHVALAQLALDAEDFPGAEEHLRRILQSDGKNAAAHVDLGIALKGQGQYDKAMQEYDEAEKLNPDLGATYLNRGIILHKVKDAPERAVELYRKYVALAGGEVALNAEAPVFGLLREAESIVQAKREAKAAEEQAKQMEALQAQQQAAMKAEEARQKGQPAPNAATPVSGDGTAPKATPAAATGNQPAAATPAGGTPAAPAQKNAAPVDADEPTDDLL
ncbi:adventurous gliding motility TPR repeat lipoprotein GltE [Corallococcus sp. BB11-1]|uniref:adventurous gliding motility TPR repeat lipoprotein GltE n=1 Tax=Corallococcus sp. BB11-1 TaxID=2996783 RepID=UPI00226E23E7|nr:adventurous gliding motility TPR repeat lipoprotein GltE [Corallococcus sp. BB11-1]MCY1031434.1 adventurous gliding motility TPR repeat lipoprotein GltE [Corallococcus sp. BB11-1]